MANAAIGDFTNLLRECTKFTCVVYGLFEGEGVYHILAVIEEKMVAVKFYERSRRKWIYFFVDIDKLWIYHKKDWIELKRG